MAGIVKVSSKALAVGVGDVLLLGVVLFGGVWLVVQVEKAITGAAAGSGSGSSDGSGVTFLKTVAGVATGAGPSGPSNSDSPYLTPTNESFWDFIGGNALMKSIFGDSSTPGVFESFFIGDSSGSAPWVLGGSSGSQLESNQQGAEEVGLVNPDGPVPVTQDGLANYFNGPMQG